jgi:dihydropteroate synthase
MIEPSKILSWPMRKLDFSKGTLVMGILNVTPDSFSDGGEWLDPAGAFQHGLDMVSEGAAIIDIGAESTRPGSEAVPAEEQIRRAIPVIKELSKVVPVPISIDTADAYVAEAAVEAGAAIINDVTALADDRMAKLAAKRQVPVVLMHMKGQPKTMQVSPEYGDVVGEVSEFLLARAKRAESFGIPRERIIVDPGIGFGKTLEHNCTLLANLNRFVAMGYPVLVGHSRKRFLSAITGKPSSELATATAAVTALCAKAGVAIVRVHDVAENVDACKVSAALKSGK